MKILNIGCGSHVNPDFINLDNDIVLKLKASPFSRIILSKQELDWRQLRRCITFADASKGLPFETGSMDVVYSSHLLEHIDFLHREFFMNEVFRVLRYGGVHRIVVPDLEPKLRAVIDQLDHLSLASDSSCLHEATIFQIFEQSVRKVPNGYEVFNKSLQKFFLKLFGDAQRRGETHQMMYTSLSLSNLLKRTGFQDIKFYECNSSQIPNWAGYKMETNLEGQELHSGSIYVESIKPNTN